MTSTLLWKWHTKLFSATIRDRLYPEIFLTWATGFVVKLVLYLLSGHISHEILVYTGKVFLHKYYVFSVMLCDSRVKPVLPTDRGFLTVFGSTSFGRKKQGHSVSSMIFADWVKQVLIQCFSHLWGYSLWCRYVGLHYILKCTCYCVSQSVVESI